MFYAWLLDILRLAAQINTAACELLLLVREFDERAGWLKWGFDSCAQWLHWRCDLGMSAAREKVRVAHALKLLPEIAQAFASGELSYSKVRPLTRVARRDNDASLVAFALKTTASRVEERCRELRCGTLASVDEAHRAHANRCSRHHRLVHEGGIRIERDYQNRWFFQRPDGRSVPAYGYRAQDVIDNDSDNAIARDIEELSRVINKPSAEGLLAGDQAMT